jgi:hypothetical protein
VTLLSIAYLSAAAEPFSPTDIAALLSTSRANNARAELTGALLYHRGRFAQILEGPEDEVRAKFAVISADGRHHNVQVMRERVIPSRQFPRWTMGIRETAGDSITELDGFEDILNRRGRARLEHAENEAQQFLEWLGEYWLPLR